MVRFTDAEWAELQTGAAQLGETRSEAIRAGGLAWVRGVASTLVTLPRHLFACAFCPAEFTTESEAVTHIDAVHGDKP